MVMAVGSMVRSHPLKLRPETLSRYTSREQTRKVFAIILDAIMVMRPQTMTSKWKYFRALSAKLNYSTYNRSVIICLLIHHFPVYCHLIFLSLCHTLCQFTRTRIKWRQRCVGPHINHLRKFLPQKFFGFDTAAHRYANCVTVWWKAGEKRGKDGGNRLPLIRFIINKFGWQTKHSSFKNGKHTHQWAQF